MTYNTSRRLRLLFCLVLTLCLVATSVSADDLTEAEFKRLHQELQISKNDAWRKIPWMISLLNAQQQAAKDQKPIFIWAMDGHPLGCT